MFENKLTKYYGIHYTRYIASWINVGGHTFGEAFIKWLRSLALTEMEIQEIRKLAMNGKLELETSAKNYVRQQNWES